MLEELEKEWTKLGNLFLEESEWVEPEQAHHICQVWMQKFSVRNADGAVLMPPRVKHPGKAWILKQMEEVSKQEAPKGDQKDKAESTEGKGVFASVAEYVVRLRSGTFHLLGLDCEGAKVTDVELPGPKADEDFNYEISEVDGEYYFAAVTLGDETEAEYLSCEDFTKENMPKGVLQNRLPGAGEFPN